MAGLFIKLQFWNSFTTLCYGRVSVNAERRREHFPDRINAELRTGTLKIHAILSATHIPKRRRRCASSRRAALVWRGRFFKEHFFHFNYSDLVEFSRIGIDEVRASSGEAWRAETVGFGLIWLGGEVNCVWSWIVFCWSATSLANEGVPLEHISPFIGCIVAWVSRRV